MNLLLLMEGDCKEIQEKNTFRRVSDQFQLNMRAFSPKLPEVGEDLSIADLRNNKLTNKFIAAGKLAATIELIPECLS